MTKKHQEWLNTHPEYRSNYNKEYYKNNKDSISKQVRNYARKKDTGWGKNLYQNAYEKQHASCIICGAHEDSLDHILAADHDHIKDTPRALLCRNCNLSLGYMKDAQESALMALIYLNFYTKFSEKDTYLYLDRENALANLKDDILKKINTWTDEYHALLVKENNVFKDSD